MMRAQEFKSKKENISISLPSSTPISNHLLSFINDVLQYTYREDSKNTDNTGVTEDRKDKNNINFSTNIPLFFNQGNILKIPTKIEYALRRYTPKELMRKIHPDINVSVELCLLFTTKLTKTYFEMLSDGKSDGWVALKSEYLRDFFSTSSLTYKYVREALEYNLKTGPIIECDDIYEKGVKSFHYRLGEAYVGKGMVSYNLKTDEALSLLKKHNERLYNNAQQNPICQNLLHFYQDITLPTIAEIELKGKELVKEKYLTKKGKKLVFRNKHKDSYFKDSKKLSFVEDDIKLYRYLTENGLRIPTPGDARSGGRIVDSFTLMPSWIRKMIKIGGEPYTECDYSCLHPNIACSLYGGDKKFIKHLDLAQESGIDELIVKKEHLSFFNKEVRKMKPSPLFEYYQKHEPGMLKRIINEKYQDRYEHKITSRKMFGKEVEIMTDVINRLNKEGIYVGYIYDALFCHPKHAQHVKQTMDQVILNHGVKTTAKIAA